MTVAILIGPGCSFSPGGATGVDAEPDSIDAAPQTPDAPPCLGDFLDYSASNFDKCQIAAPMPALNLAADTWTLHTDDRTLRNGAGDLMQLDQTLNVTQTDAPPIRVFAFQDIDIADGAILRVIGVRTAALVSATDITIDGTINLDGTGDVSGAGGGQAQYCATSAGQNGATQMDPQGDQGGSGGSGAGHGGSGSNGSGIAGNQPGTSQGVPSGSETLIPLRGGCRGGNGGNSSSAGTGGRGGAAGGAIQLVAASTLTVGLTGAISARGGNGLGGQAPAGGGGGGGSAGAILLEAQTITINGYLNAIGGAGGEGASTGSNGVDGNTGTPTELTPPAGGLGGSVGGGNGGNGGVSSDQLPSSGRSGQVANDGGEVNGGGGGGGSYGRIRINAYASLNKIDLQIAPPAEIRPGI